MQRLEKAHPTVKVYATQINIEKHELLMAQILPSQNPLKKILKLQREMKHILSKYLYVEMFQPILFILVWLFCM